MFDHTGLSSQRSPYEVEFPVTVPPRVVRATPVEISRRLVGANLRAFVEAGNGTMRVLSLRTRRAWVFTMKTAQNSPNVVFVKDGSTFIGTVFMNNRYWAVSTRCPAASYEASEVFEWLLRTSVWGDRDVPGCVVEHIGHCARCGGRLEGESENRAGLHEGCLI